MLHSVLQALIHFNEDFACSWVNCVIRYLGTKTALSNVTANGKRTSNGCIFKILVNISACLSYKLILLPLKSSFALCLVQGCKKEGVQKAIDVTSWVMGYKASKNSEQWLLVTDCRLQQLQSSCFQLIPVVRQIPSLHSCVGFPGLFLFILPVG